MVADNRRDLLCGNWESVEGKPDVLIYKEELHKTKDHREIALDMIGNNYQNHVRKCFRTAHLIGDDGGGSSYLCFYF